jgi:WhiB family redox-sensing transcriptional regulator
MPDETWMELGACRGTFVDFHPSILGAAEQRPAKTVCYGCEVKQTCLDYAISERIWEGIWGGLNGRERESYKRRIARKKLEERRREECERESV